MIRLPNWLCHNLDLHAWVYTAPLHALVTKVCLRCGETGMEHKKKENDRLAHN